MNISTGSYVERFAVDITASEGGSRAEGPGLDADIREHHEILGRSGKWTPTGEVALVSDPDPNYPGALQVWSKTAEGVWIWVNPEGEIIESACPIGD